MRFLTPFLKKTISCALFSLIGFSVIPASALDYSNSLISVDEIYSGGPPKDGIPALIDPDFIVPQKATYLLPHDRVIGVEINGQAKAYPLKILNWHELVNDRLAGEDILVTYCPLCGSGIVFNATIREKRVLFGVSGLLYKSDVLFYDLATESLWSQLAMKSITGAYSGTNLQRVPLVVTTWREWTTKYPETQVLSIDTGYERDYGTDPYFIYSVTSQIHFPNLDKDRRLDPKQWVYGILVGETPKAYPLSELVRSKQPISDTVNGISFHIDYDRVEKTVRIFSAENQLVAGVECYWFAWSSFYPQTQVYRATNS